MRGINKVIIVGEVISKINYRKTSKNIPVCTFKVKTSYKKSDGSYKDEEHNIEVWDKLAKLCNDNLTPHRIIYVEGRNETEEWGEENNKKYRTKIVCNTVEFLDEKPKNVANIIDQII